jgi:hypothetical protein
MIIFSLKLIFFYLALMSTMYWYEATKGWKVFVADRIFPVICWTLFLACFLW